MTAGGDRSSGPWAAIALAGLAAYAATAAVTPLANNDIWIHLTTGGLILDEGSVPKVDRYSFTAEGNRYVAHEWLAAVLYALAERAGGVTGVILSAKLVPALATLGFFVAALAATGAPRAIALPLCVLTLTIARHRVTARPELIAFALLCLTLWLLLRDRAAAREGRRSRAVGWLVVVEAVWANFHGSFPIGVLLVLVFAAGEAADLLLSRRDRVAAGVRVAGVALGIAAAAWLWGRPPSAFGPPAAALVLAGAALFAVDGRWRLFDEQPRASWPRVAKLTGLAAAMLLAVAANPRGAEIYLFPFEFTAGVNEVTRLVDEWKPLFGVPKIRSSLPFVSFLGFAGCWAAALALCAWRGRLGRTEVVLLFALSLLPLLHSRWMALVALATTPALAATLHAGARAGRGRSVARGAVAALCLAAAVAALAASVAVQERGPALSATYAVSMLAAAVSFAAALRPRLPAAVGPCATALASAALVALALLHGISERPGVPRRPALGVKRQPVAPVEFMREHAIRGNLFTEYELAGFVIHQLWPDVRVFIDSRSEVYGPGLLEQYLWARVRPNVARRALKEQGADLVMVQYPPYPRSLLFNAGVLGAVESDPSWSLIYIDDRYVVYGRRVPDRELPAGFEHIAPRRLQPDDLDKADPRFAAEVRRALERAPDSAVLHTALGASLRAQGRPEEARAEVDRAWAANPSYPGAPYLAGLLAAEAGDAEAAREWLGRAQAAKPEWDAPRRALEALEP